jgi:hypothetical protein
MRRLTIALALVLLGCMPDPGGPMDDDGDGDGAGGGGTGGGGMEGGGGGTTTGGNARALFDDTVRPILQATCSAATCHGGVGTSPLKFIPPSLDDYYSVVTGYPDRVVGWFDKSVAPMLNRITPGPHYTASYDAAEAQLVRDWLDAEVVARSGGGGGGGGGGGTPTPTPGETSTALIQEWSGCMDLAIWLEEDVAVRWAQKGSSEGPCIQCHINGQASFIATDDETRMFNVVTTNKYFMQPYFTPDVTDLANARMVINRSIFERVGSAQYPFIAHPLFDVDGQAFQQLTAFYERTMAAMAAGTCAPPRITD